MNYYIRYNNQTMGPFAEEQIINFLQQGRFNDSVRFSADLTRWYPAWEISAFRNIPLQQAPASNNDVRFPRNSASRTRRSANKDHSVLYFMGFCLVAVLGFVVIIYAINKDDATPEEIAENFTADSLPAVYQKKQRAIGLVTITFQNEEGGLSTVPVGTAFAISKNKFVTNAHVAYTVKNWFEKYFVMPYLNEEAEKKRKSLEAYLQEIGDRGFEQARTMLLEFWKKLGLKIRDIEIRLNHSNGKSFRVAEVQVHPRYNPSNHTGEYDVAIFKISGSTDCYFDVASKKELHSLRAGIPVASAGFPSEGLSDLNIEKPEASYATGDIKKITDFNNKDGGADNNRSIFHSIPAAGGASGSPIFIANGKVIAVLWGGTDHGCDASGARIVSAALQNFAVRIDQIYDVGEPVSWSTWTNDPTKNISYSSFEREPSVTASSTPVSAPPVRSFYDNSDERAKAKAEYKLKYNF